MMLCVYHRALIFQVSLPYFSHAFDILLWSSVERAVSCDFCFHASFSYSHHISHKVVSYKFKLRPHSQLVVQTSLWSYETFFCRTGAHKFPKNLIAASEVYVPEGWHGASSILRTHSFGVTCESHSYWRLLLSACELIQIFCF